MRDGTRYMMIPRERRGTETNGEIEMGGGGGVLTAELCTTSMVLRNSLSVNALANGSMLIFHFKNGNLTNAYFSF
jgi:hypothetical protein